MTWAASLAAIAAWRLGQDRPVAADAGHRGRAGRALLLRVHDLGLGAFSAPIEPRAGKGGGRCQRRAGWRRGLQSARERGHGHGRPLHRHDPRALEPATPGSARPSGAARRGGRSLAAQARGHAQHLGRAGGVHRPGIAGDVLRPRPRCPRLPTNRQAARRLWRVVRHPDPFPPARVARIERFADDWPSLNAYLSRNEARDEVWFDTAEAIRRESAPAARAARVVSWDGREAVVDHDGSCVLVITRAFDRDWRARVGDGAEVPVLRVDGGLQAVKLSGKGPTRVSFRYEPRFVRQSAAVSVVAALAAFGVVAGSAAKRVPRPAPGS